MIEECPLDEKFQLSIEENSTADHKIGLINMEPFLEQSLTVFSKITKDVETLEIFEETTPIANTILKEISEEWPEIFSIIIKLKSGSPLEREEEEWIEEISRVTGWEVEDVKEELKHTDADPSRRAVRYRNLFEKYLNEALIEKENGNREQAAEKMWGAITALIKFYAAIKGIPIIHWSLGKLEKAIRNNFEREDKEIFIKLFYRGMRLHHYFYEGSLDISSFEDIWKEVLELLEMAKKITTDMPLGRSNI